MSDFTQLLGAIDASDPKASDQLLPLVYDELRKLAAHRITQEKPGQTLQATALVHEAWLRLIGPEQQSWDSRGHFFAAAAEAMRRILVENARCTASGSRSITSKNARDAALGTRRPCSQSCTVRILTPKCSANAVWLMPTFVRMRRMLISSGTCDL